MPDTPATYYAHQTAFHEAFRPDLYRVLDALPLPPAARVLDVPCGDGFYAARLADRLPPGGTLVAADASDDYLARARSRLGDRPGVEVRKVDAFHLPFPDHSFDLVWCAQSLISLDPEPAVREMFRVTKAGGLTAILEADGFHHVVLSWPVELEAEIPAAVCAASRKKYGDGGKLAPARRLRELLRRAGYQDIRRVSFAADRSAPFDPATAAFLRHHLEYLRNLLGPHLPGALRPTFDRLTHSDGPASLLTCPDSELTCLNVAYLARPESASS